MNSYQISINGLSKADITDFGQEDALIRSVLISLFTWRRANEDDIAEGQKMGWWGDVVEPPAINDQIGSKLWLLRREKITQSTINRAREYAKESLQWLIDDGVASRVDVETERFQIDGIAIGCTIYRVDGGNIALRFDDAWRVIRGI
ncbi:MAG: phage GP46 family protein [Methylophilaceae bacterium]